VLAASGLPELEAGVLGFLGRRAAVLHQVALLDDAERLLAQVGAPGGARLPGRVRGTPGMRIICCSEKNQRLPAFLREGAGSRQVPTHMAAACAHPPTQHPPPPPHTHTTNRCTT
jgi:hypothetical protein